MTIALHAHGIFLFQYHFCLGTIFSTACTPQIMQNFSHCLTVWAISQWCSEHLGGITIPSSLDAIQTCAPLVLKAKVVLKTSGGSAQLKWDNIKILIVNWYDFLERVIQEILSGLGKNIRTNFLWIRLTSCNWVQFFTIIYLRSAAPGGMQPCLLHDD